MCTVRRRHRNFYGCRISVAPLLGRSDQRKISTVAQGSRFLSDHRSKHYHWSCGWGAVHPDHFFAVGGGPRKRSHESIKNTTTQRLWRSYCDQSWNVESRGGTRIKQSLSKIYGAWDNRGSDVNLFLGHHNSTMPAARQNRSQGPRSNGVLGRAKTRSMNHGDPDTRHTHLLPRCPVPIFRGCSLASWLTCSSLWVKIRERGCLTSRTNAGHSCPGGIHRQELSHEDPKSFEVTPDRSICNGAP